MKLIRLAPILTVTVQVLSFISSILENMFFVTIHRTWLITYSSFRLPQSTVAYDMDSFSFLLLAWIKKMNFEINPRQMRLI